jgi:hypothetical protein
MFEQVGRARVADGFVTGSHAVQDEEGGNRGRRLRHENHLQPVLEEKFVRRSRRRFDHSAMDSTIAPDFFEKVLPG